MKVVVTGGAGFIGSHIAEALLKRRYEVIIIDDLSAGKEKNIPEGATFMQANVISDGWKRVLKGVDAIFHNAASKKNICLIDPGYDLMVNGGGTLGLLRACAKAGVNQFIHASTGSVYGEVKGVITEDTPTNPVSYYGVSKLAGEKYVALFADKMNTTVLRYFHVYGERQEDDPDLGGVIAVFKRQIAEGKPLTIHGDGSQKRVFTHVDDVVRANLAAFDKNETGAVYNCASTYKTSIMAVAGALIRKAGKPINFKYLDSLPGDIYDFDVNNDKICLNLGLDFPGYAL